MIKILFCMPYESMRSRIMDVLATYVSEEKIEAECLLCDNSAEFQKNILRYLKTSEPSACAYDAVVARGMTVSVLRKSSLDIPITELGVNSTDIVNTIQKCRELYHTRKVAVVGPVSMFYAAKAISALSTLPIEVYYLHESGEITEIAAKALSSGCDAIIGGTTAYNYAKQKGIPCVMLENSDETLWSAIEEAVHSVGLQRREREQAEFLNVVMNNYKEGIVVIDAKKNIKVINQFAAEAVGANIEACLRKNVMTLFYDLSGSINSAFMAQKTTYNEIFCRKGRTFSTTVIPIVMHTQTISAILCLDDVRSIQKNEQQIRNKLYRKEMTAHYTFCDIVHVSRAMGDLIEQAAKFSNVESNILITGETGTGKEVFAQGIHNFSQRKLAPFVAVNCAALPEHLLESELFGYSDGAFTGAVKGGKPGLFEIAHNGTLFLDEISEIPLTLQGKLLRVLQEKEIRKIGDNRVIPINVRLIAATNKNLFEMKQKNLFRQDLYYRLNVLTLNIMPLRERKDDILPLLQHFFGIFEKTLRKKPPHLTDEAAELLSNYPWEGNIRELQNVAERIMVLSEGNMVSAQALEAKYLSAFYADRPMGDEAKQIEQVLQQCANRNEAAVLLGMSRSTLWRKMKEYHLLKRL